MPINEPRIFTRTPIWVDMEEVETKNWLVQFRTGNRKMFVPVRDVDRWKSRKKVKSTLLSK